jgi:GNAT superfamily N-acetyltransferase
MAGSVTVRPLQRTLPAMSDLQRVLDATPRYFMLVTGQPVASTAADILCSTLPPGKRPDDKFVYGVFENDDMVGCADVIRAFPDSATACIGLFLIAEPWQRRGIGRAAYQLLEKLLREWACSRILLGVVLANAGVLAFWENAGFVQTGETRPYQHGTVVSETIMLSKTL